MNVAKINQFDLQQFSDIFWQFFPPEQRHVLGRSGPEQSWDSGNFDDKTRTSVSFKYKPPHAAPKSHLPPSAEELLDIYATHTMPEGTIHIHFPILSATNTGSHKSYRELHGAICLSLEQAAIKIITLCGIEKTAKAWGANECQSKA